MSVSVIAAVVAVAGLATKLLDKIPEFEKEKRKELYELRETLLKLSNEDEPDWQLAMNICDKITLLAGTLEGKL